MALPNLEGDFLPLEIPNEGFGNPELTQTSSLTPSDTLHELDTKPDLGAAEAAPTTDPDVVSKRAQKAHLALGEKSPGLSVLRNQMDMGEEPALREAVAAEQALEDRKFRLGLVQEATRKIDRPLTLSEADELMSIMKVDARKDPSTILEELYGQRVVSTIPAMLKDPSIHQQALNTLPEEYLDTADASAQHIAKNQIAQAVLQDVNAEWEKQGIFSTVKNYAKQLVPFWSYANLTSAVENAPTAFSLEFGRTIQEEVDYLYSLKPSEFKKELTAAIRKISEDSPLDALLFAQGVISYSSNDRAIDNVLGALDMSVFLMPFRGLRGAKVAAGTTPTPSGPVKAAEDIQRVIDARPARVPDAGIVPVQQASAPVELTKVPGLSVVWEPQSATLTMSSGPTRLETLAKAANEANLNDFDAVFELERAYPGLPLAQLGDIPPSIINNPKKVYDYAAINEAADALAFEHLGRKFDTLFKGISGEDVMFSTAEDFGVAGGETTLKKWAQEGLNDFANQIRSALGNGTYTDEMFVNLAESLDAQVQRQIAEFKKAGTRPTKLKPLDPTAAISDIRPQVKLGEVANQNTLLPDLKAWLQRFRDKYPIPASVDFGGSFTGKSQSIKIDVDKILAKANAVPDPGRFKKAYNTGKAGLYNFMKAFGYGPSILKDDFTDKAMVTKMATDLVENTTVHPGQRAAMKAFLNDNFDVWPTYVFGKNKAQHTLEPRGGLSTVEGDFDYLYGATKDIQKTGRPLYKGANKLPAKLLDDANRYFEFFLWHETAHSVIIQAKGQSIAQYENVINAAAMLKTFKQAYATGVSGSLKPDFGHYPEPIPYQMKDFSKATGGVREPAVVFVEGSPKGSFTVFDKATRTVTVYRDALRKQFERKPWKNTKTAGVKAMPDDDFQTADDWVDFSVEKTKLRGILNRNTGESKALYENRLNQLALQSLRNTKAQKGVIVNNMFRDVTRAGMAEDIPEGMSRSGMFEETVDVGVMQRVQDEWMGKDPLDDSLSLRTRTPSIFSLESLGQSFTRERTDRIFNSLRKNAKTLLGIPLNNSAIVRLPEQALQVAIDETKANLSKTYGHVNEAFLDVSFDGPFAVTRPEEQLVNTTVVHLRLGKPDASLFDTPSQAAIYGVDMYGLSPNAFSILQNGNGFYINIAKSIDETLDGVRDVLISTDNKSEGGFLNAFLSLLRTPEDQLSKLQNANRKLATTAAQELHRLMLDSSKAISKNISKQEREQLSGIWQRNRDFIDEATGERGYFYKTISEFEDAFHDRFKGMPTEGQTEAYFTYVQLMDMDYILRNLALHRDLSRVGAERVRVFTDVMVEGGLTAATPSRPFAGRITERIPFEDTSEDFGIWVYDPRTKKGEFHLRSQVTKDVLDDIEGKTTKDGFRIIEVVNPIEKPLLEAAQTSETIHFAVVKQFDNVKFDWGILPYRPGGHVEYGDQFFVKQPRIRRSTASGSLRHIYEGDVSLLSAATSAEATKWAKVADDARKLLRAGKEEELRDFLDKNAPWNIDEFKAFFTEREMPDGSIKPALLHMDDSITWTHTGRNTSDMDHFKQTLTGYDNYFNAIRSKYNLFAQSVDKKYLGSRDPDLPRVEELGTEQQPIFKLAKPRLLSPLETLNKSIANVTRSRHMTDYKTTAIESFIEEFADVMQLPHGGKAELRRNPVYYFHNPPWDTETTNKTLLAAAKATRRANLMFIGTESELGSKLFWLQSKLVDQIYTKLGQKASNFVTEKYLPTVKDPITYARSIAFHTKLGLFNPVQLALQAQSFVHVMAVAGPGVALRAAGDAVRMRQLALTENEDIINQFARWSGNADIFKESYRELKSTGYYNVGGEVAWRDDVFEPNMFKGPVGTFLEKGTVFFDEGERFVRLSAWNAAFYEWRAANPTKKIDNLTRNQILQRADLMAVNMTRASNAAWQNGLWSVPTQFLAFQARLAEQLLPGFSSRLTAAEKRRAYLTYSAVYGLPVGAGATFGVYPFYEDIRQAALERGVQLDNKLLQAAHEGMMSTLLSVVSGKDYNINERFGPGGTTLFKEVVNGEKPVMDLLLGASGSILGDMISSAAPATNAFLSLFSMDVDPPTMEDFLEVTRNVSTINNAAKAWYMYNQGRFFTRNGSSVIDNATGFDAFMTGVLGVSPRDATDTFLMIRSRKEQRAAEDAAEKEIIKYYRMAIREYNNNDRELGDTYLKRAKAWLVSSGINPDKYSSIISKAVKNNETLFNSVREDFWRKAPAGQVLDRKNMIQEQTQ